MALPPTPQGFKAVELHLDPATMNTLHLLSCKECGALTVYASLHKKWHKDQEPKKR